ncbi:MAG: hypothetical protein KAI79_15730 [Bacteroidales bacterium]|nr:hypothetical protein [Bacteroidales bacterium]
MNTNFFEITKPKFISVREQKFIIDNKKYTTLTVNIQDLLPVKKFFNNGKLLCYAINSNSSSTGKNCTLCADRFKCFMKVRIMMQINSIDNDPIPAALEIGKKDFKSLQVIIDNIPQNELSTKNININFNASSLFFTLEN